MRDPLEPTARGPDDALDRVLRQELRWEAPPEVTACLLGLIPDRTLWAETLQRPRPQLWYSTLVLILTAVAVGLSLAVAWQIIGSLSAELGFIAILEQLRAAPAIGLQRLYEALPVSRQIVAVLVIVREQIHWLLVAMILWLALDGWQPGRLSTRQTR